MFKGNIPNEIKFLPKAKSANIKFSWSSLEDKYNNDFLHHSLEGKYCSVIIPGGKLEQNKGVCSLPNIPMTGLKIAGVSYHNNTPDQILVLLPNGFLVEMEFDSFIEAALNVGIQLGASIPGEWVWAKVPGKMKLIRLGTGIHDAILDFQKREKQPTFKPKELNVGKIYKTADGKMALFLGFINSYTMNLHIHPEDKELANEKSYYRNREEKKKIRYEVAFNKVKLATLWYEIWGKESNLDESRKTKIVTEIKSGMAYGIKAIKNHLYVEESLIEKLDVPDDVIMMYRATAAKSLEETLIRFLEREKNQLIYFPAGSRVKTSITPPTNLTDFIPTYDVAKHVRLEAMMANMVPFGVEPMICDHYSIFKRFFKK